MIPPPVKVAKESAVAFVKDDAPAHAAAVAFYMVLSLAPLLLVAVAVASVFARQDSVREEVVGQFNSLVGESGGQLVTSLLASDAQPAKGAWATVVGVLVLIAGASGAFAQLKTALNRIWGIEVSPRGGPWYAAAVRFIVGRFLSFAMVLIIGFLLLASLVISAALAGVGSWTSGVLPAHEALMRAINFVVSLGVVAVLFALIFKVLPNAKVGWREVWFGAIITSLLFNVGKYLIGLYLGRSSVASPYGAAGSVILILLWLYYSAMILLLGAEITQATAQHLGKAIQPAKGFVTAQEKEALR